ncbi:MAG: hypothetical protein GY943_30080 [Chloroflexi bacterium]|nr:hypothetical protein [Chloroflexota bacterium]
MVNGKITITRYHYFTIALVGNGRLHGQWLIVNCQLSMRRGASLAIDHWQLVIFKELLVIELVKM